MAVKRVTDSYTRGIQTFANARRTPQSQAVRPASHKPVPPHPTAPRPTSSEHPVPVAVREASEGAIAGIAVDIAKLQRAAKTTSERAAPVDYHDIIAKSVATLNNSTVEARHAVYECARQVVYQRLARIRPALPAEQIERERLALDLAIEKIETAARGSQAIAPSELPATETVPAPRAIAPVVMIAPRRDLPQAKHFHSGALRLFAMTGLVCAGMFGYWLATGKPEFRSAVTYFHIFPSFPSAANNDSAASPDLGVAEERLSSINPSPQPAAAATAPNLASDPTAIIAQRGTKTTERNSRSSKAIANMQAPSGNPPIGLNIPCTSPLCDNASPNPLSAAEFSTTEPGPSSWASTYAGVALKPPAAPLTPFAKPNASVRAGPSLRTATAPSAAGYFERGLEQARGGDPERAIRDFSDAIRADPNFSDAYLQRGNMRFKSGNADLAIDDFRDAIRVEPRNAAAFKARGMALLYKGDEDLALEDLTRAIQIAEADTTKLSVIELFFARRSRAAMQARKHNSERELLDLGTMIDAYWKNPDLADALKVNYGTQGAAAAMASIYRQRANLYQQRANIDGAISDLSYALQLDPAHALAVIVERARVQEAAGRREQAAADFKRALELNPRFQEAKQALVRLKTPQ